MLTDTLLSKPMGPNKGVVQSEMRIIGTSQGHVPSNEIPIACHYIRLADVTLFSCNVVFAIIV